MGCNTHMLFRHSSHLIYPSARVVSSPRALHEPSILVDVEYHDAGSESGVPESRQAT